MRLLFRVAAFTIRTRVIPRTMTSESGTFSNMVPVQTATHLPDLVTSRWTEPKRTETPTLKLYNSLTKQKVNGILPFCVCLCA